MSAEHTCTKHEPGTRTCYVAHGCRCAPCRAEATRWQRHFNHAKRTTGHGLTIPADPVRAHIDRLRADGMTLRELAKVSGVSLGTVRNIIEQKVDRTTRKTAERLAAVRRRTEPGHGHVDAKGTARRLQALAAIGYDGTDLAPMLGWSPNYVRHLRAPETPAVHAATRDRVAELYTRLQAAPKDGGRVRKLAERRGWAPPLAWDDGTGPHGIDNPKARPHPWRRRDSDRRRSRHDISDLRALGLADTEIAHRLGIQPKSLQRRHAARTRSS